MVCGVNFCPPPQGVSLPKAQNKFENFLKHGYKVSDAKVQYTFVPWPLSFVVDLFLK